MLTLVFLEDVFPRKCSFTGKGMYKGWLLGGAYMIDDTDEDGYSPSLEKYCKEVHDQTVDEFWEEVNDEGLDDWYWSDWGDLDELDHEAFTAEGELLTQIGFDTWKDEKGTEYKIVSN